MEKYIQTLQIFFSLYIIKEVRYFNKPPITKHKLLLFNFIGLNSKRLTEKINQFPPKLKKILQFRLKSIEGFTLREIADYTDTKYETVRHEIYLCNKKGLRFQEVKNEINKEILLGRKIALDEKFYKMVCESNDLEEVRKSIKTFYETQKLINTENKQQINIQNNISIPVSVKDIRPVDIIENDG